MRSLACLLVLALVSQTMAARQLMFGWSSASSLGQLTTATGANTNAGLLSTVSPGQGNDAGMLAGGSQTGGLGNANSDAEEAQPALPPGAARAPAIPGTSAYARQQALLKQARAPGPAPALAPAFGALFANARGPAASAAAGPAASAAAAEAGAASPTIYVSHNTAEDYMNTALAPDMAPSGVGAPDALHGFQPLLGPFPEGSQQPADGTAAASQAASGRPIDLAPITAPAPAPFLAPRMAPAPAPHRAPAPAPTRSGPFARLPDPFLADAPKLIWTAG